MCNSRHPGPRRVWKGGSDSPGLTPFPADPLGELSLQNDPSNFVGRRGSSEPYPSKPLRPPFKFDTLKTRGFVYAKQHFSQKGVVLLKRNTHFQNASLHGFPKVIKKHRRFHISAILDLLWAFLSSLGVPLTPCGLPLGSLGPPCDYSGFPVAL